MSKKLISLFLSVTFVLSLMILPVTPVLADYTGGSGTRDDPYLINTAEDLQSLATAVNSGTTYADCYFKMTADIDLSTVCSEESGTSWTPISNAFIRYFKGTFDGNGHEVQNLYISGESKWQGLFGYNNGTIMNLSVTGSVSGDMYVGGICGQNNGTIENCFSNVTVSGNSYVGGISGQNGNTTTNCYNLGTISGTSYVGGVSGQNNKTLSSCYNIGTVIGENNVGSICGQNNSTASNCYYLEGTVSDSSATVKTAEEFASQETFADWDFDSTWSMSAVLGRPVLQAVSESLKSLFDGEGTEDSPYLIPDLATLELLCKYVNAGYGDGEYFKLTADIDMSAEYSEETGKSWTPIGTYTDYFNNVPFKGVFDGDGHEIQNLYISGEGKWQGLFCANKGTIKNLGVSGTVNGAGWVSVICGTNYGTIENCYSSGTVTGTDNYAGGICGQNNSTVINCYNTASVSGTGYVGGISGQTNGTTSICYNVGEVSGTSYVGSASGQTNGTAENCYYLDGTSADGKATVKTEDEFVSGEVAYLLQEANGGNEAEKVWGQNINRESDSDKYPTFTGDPVYKVTALTSDGETISVSYANSGYAVLPDEPTKTGYEFVKWVVSDSTSADEFTTDYKITADTNIYAVMQEQYGEVDDTHSVETTYGTEATLNLAACVGYADETESAGKFDYAFASDEIEGISIDGDILSVSNTVPAGNYALTVYAIEKDTQLAIYSLKESGTEDVEFEVAVSVDKAVLTPTVNADSKVYDGTTSATGTVSFERVVNDEQPEATATFTFESADVGENKEVTVKDIALTDEWSGNYVLSTDSLTTTAAITAKDISSVEVALGNSLTYTGSEQTQTVGSVSIDGLDVTYEVSGNAATDAGTHTLTITGTGNFTGMLTKDFTIAQAENEISEFTCADIAYGDTPQPTVSVLFGSDSVTYSYSNEEDGTFEEWNSENDAGTWYVKASVAETTNYTGAEKVIAFEVSEKQEEEPDTVTVEFDSQGGSSVESQSISAGDKVTKPTDPTWSGYTFGGWYTESTCTTAWNFDDTVASDLTLYAKWTADTNSETSDGDDTGNDTEGNTGSSTGSNTGSSTGSSTTTGGSISAGSSTTTGSSSTTGNTSTDTTADIPTVTVGNDGEGGKFEIEDDGTVVITPDDGYEISKITVNDEEVAIPEDGKFTDLTKADTVEIIFSEIIIPVSQKFTDVADGAWFEDSVQYVVDNGLFVGTSDTKFSPNMEMTRGMLVTVLYRLENSPEIDAENVFDDVADGKYYTEAIVWATETGVVNGYGDGSFGPDDPITRQQLAAILWRYAGSSDSTETLDRFRDADEISAYAVNAMKWAVENGIVEGKGNGILDPKGNATRAEVATMLMRFCEFTDTVK